MSSQYFREEKYILYQHPTSTQEVLSFHKGNLFLKLYKTAQQPFFWFSKLIVVQIMMNKNAVLKFPPHIQRSVTHILCCVITRVADPDPVFVVVKRTDSVF